MKKKLTITAWTRITASLLFFSLWGLGGWGFGLFAQVQVTPLSATYTASPIVKFRVSWTNQSTDNHPPKVWVIIDYDKVENNVAAHNWQPAIITDATATGGTVTQHLPRGFFLAGAQTGFSADVTVTLSGMPAQFNWCAYALDFPPNATIKTGGGYDLHGTPPFTINGNIIAPDKVFAAGTCITSITDATGNPAGIVPDPPSITLSTGSSAQTATQNAALPALKYTTANASGASLMSGSFPAGVSGSWTNNTYTISGTPTATGTFTYTVTTTNSQSCTNASKTGTITVNLAYTGCVTASITLGTVGFTSSATWSRNGLTISSPVTATYCNTRAATSIDCGESYAGKVDCAKNSRSTTYGNWISWCMVKQYAMQLCPAPWRVPTAAEHCLITNGDETNCEMKAYSGLTSLGYFQNNMVSNGGTQPPWVMGYWWSGTEVDQNHASWVIVYNDGGVDEASPLNNPGVKYQAAGLKCVK